MYYLFLADGFEETEALVTLDLMRRAGIDVKSVGVSGETINGTHGIRVLPDIACQDVRKENCDGIVLPGGMPGTENLFASDNVCEMLEFCRKENKLIAAICAAPVIPGRRGMLNNKKAVCFPGFENELLGADVQFDLCVRDENIITAKGAGAVFEFSHEIISYIKGKGIADAVISQIQHRGL